MASIGFATLEIIPSLRGVSEAIEKQIDGKVVSVTVEPKVSQPAAEQAGKAAKATVEKHTKDVKVEPKVDQKAAEDAGKKAGDAMAKGASASTTAIGGFVVGALQGAGGEAGKRLGERIAQNIPTGLTGAAERIATALRNSLPTAGQSAGVALGTAIGVALTNAIGRERLDRAGVALMTGLTRAVNAANNATTIGVAIGNKIAGGLSSASGVIGGAAATITNTIGDVTQGVDGLKQLIGGDDSWAAPGLDAFNNALGAATPLLNVVTGAAGLFAGGAQAISVAVGVAQKAQMLWNAALVANPIGLIVTAIAAVVAGLVLFFTKTELGRKIWQGFTEYLKVAWEGIKIAFGAAWDVIKGIFDGMVNGAKLVWDNIKNQFTMVVDFVKGLPAAIGRAASGLWDGLKSGLVAVLNWISDKWNSFADSLSFKIPGTDIEVSVPKMPRFSGGGYTGAMPTDKIAGVVHGGEYVIKASSTAGIENAMPGLLDYLNNKGPLPGFAAGGLVPGTEQLRSAIAQRFGISNIGGWRPEDKYGEHSTGRALDVMTSDKALGDAIKDFAIANSSAIDLKWVIWQQRLWYPGGTSKAMPDRGNATQNHMDHVHIFSGTGITNGLRGNLVGGQAAPDTTSMLTMPDPTGVSAPDQTGLIGTAISPVSATDSSTRVTLASSISGLATTGLSNVNPKTKVSDSSPERAFDIGGAATAAIGGQIQSAMGLFGISDSPGWLKGIATLANGVTVGDSVTPVSSTTTATPATGGALDSVHSGTGTAPGPVTNYNIQTTDIEPAYLASERHRKEQVAAQLAHI